MKLFFRIFLLVISFNLTYSQSPTCATASAMCTGQGGPYNNTYPGTPGGNQTGYGPIIGCGGSGSLGNNGSLGSTPRPAWFYYTVGQTGPIVLNLQQFSAAGAGIDVDFALWGPFPNNNLANICNSLSGFPGTTYTGPCNLVDASYSTTYNETIHIPNAQVGQIYLLLVTNYSTNPTQGTYTINQTNTTVPGAGQISCNVVCGIDLGPDRLFCDSSVTSLTLRANFNQAPTSTGSPIYSWYLYNGTSFVFQSTTTTNTLPVTQEGVWKVSVQRPGCTDLAEDQIEIKFDAPPVLNTASNLLAPVGACSHTFNLTSIATGLTAPALPSSYTIRYYLNEADCYAGNSNFISNPTSYTVTTTTTIYVRVENLDNAICADATKSFDLVIQCLQVLCQLDLTSATTTTNQTLCLNSPIQNITYSYSGEATSAVVTGLPNGVTATIASGVVTISGTPTQTGVFNYTVTSVGCATNTIRQGTITINAVPVLTGLTSNTPICSGSNAIYTLQGTPGAVVSYTINGGTAQTVTIPTSGQATITVTAPSSNVNLALSSINLSGCTTTLTNSSQVVVNALPNVTSITSISPICSGSSAIFTINGTANAIVTYTLNGGTPTTTTLNASGVGTITVPNATANVSVALSLVNIGLCSRPLTLTGSVTTLTSPSITSLTSNSPICLGSNAIYTLQGNAGAVVSYTINGGTAQTVTIPTSGQATITVTAPTSNVNLVLSSINLSICTTTLTNSSQVVVNPIPSVTSITSNSPICSGASAIFTINGTANAIVTYTQNGGTPTTTTLNASGVGTITVPNATANVSVALSLVNIGLCATPSTLTGNVTTLTSPSITSLTSNSPICNNLTATFTINGTPNTTVTYTINGGTTTTIVLNATGTGTISVANATANQTLQLSNIFDGTCNRAITNAATVVVNPIPNTPTLSPQSDTFCIGENLVFNVTGGANEVILYTVNSGTNQTLNLNSSGTGIISVSNPTTQTVDINLVSITNGLCSKTLTVSSDAEIIRCDIPKGVSPNGDGLNDTWDLSGFNVKNVSIFNRYGTKVYSKSNYTNEWHGQSDNGNQLSDGTYYYVVEFNDSVVKTGWVYINR